LLPILSKLYPRALFVILVRDGRSTILSNYRKAQALYKTKVSGGRSLSDLTPKREDLRFFIREAMKWKEWMQSLERNKQLVAPESVLEIKYEELLQRPEEVLSNICEKVGVQLDERMLSPDSRSDDFVLKRDNAIIHQKVAAPLDPSRATAYESMPPWTIKIVEHYTKSVLQAHGYELSRVELPLKDRVVYKVMSAVYQGRLRNNVKSFFGSRNFSAP
jgi:hypothetical protein